MLKSYLPDFLVRNPALYSILSLGIHELTEQKCLANFEALKNGITIILDERIAQRQEAQRIKAAEIAIAKITGARGNV